MLMITVDHSLNNEEFKHKLEKEGYYALKWVDNVGWCGLFGFAFTIGLVCGLNEYGYEFRYCYPREQAIFAAVDLKVFNGNSHPTGPWIKLKGVVELSKEHSNSYTLQHILQYC